MAHRYADFNTAYTDWSADFNTAKNAKDNALSNAQAAYSGASDPVDKMHFGYATYAIELLCTAFNKTLGLNETAYDQSKCYESVFWAGQGDGGEVDMDAILNAMLKADFDQLQKFIGIVDAYRVAIWNAPFNAEFYAALARGFQKWP